MRKQSQFSGFVMLGLLCSVVVRAQAGLSLRPANVDQLVAAGIAQAAAAKPLDPVDGIINALKTHDVVALGEGDHGNEQGAAFRTKLYRDPRFQAVVNDIVVESGNGRYQAMMDRYIAGETVPEKELRMAWLETTQPTDAGGREINQKLPKEKHLRVLLGDTPYPSDPANPGARRGRSDTFPAELIEREVIAKKRKALIVYGQMHFLRRIPPPMPNQPAGTIVGLLETAGVKVFSVWTFTALGADLSTLQPDITTWKKPSLTLIKNTPLGTAPFTFYLPKDSGMTMRPGPNGPIMVDLGEAIGGVMQEQFDAVLYLGPKNEITYAGLSKSLCSDPEYVEMRAARLSAVRPPGAPTTEPSPADDFRRACKEAVNGPGTAKE